MYFKKWYLHKYQIFSRYWLSSSEKPYNPYPYNPYPYNEFAHFWWQKCGCRWSMAQSHMPKSVPSCLIILSNQPIFHYVMRSMYQIFILLVYLYFTTKTCCHVKLLGFSAIDWSGLLDFDWDHSWDKFI